MDLPRLSAKEIVESLNRWEGVEEIAALFKDAVEAENGWSLKLLFV